MEIIFEVIITLYMELMGLIVPEKNAILSVLVSFT